MPPRRSSARILLAAAALAALAPAALAQSADALLDKLVEKGVLTLDEANDLRDQADKDFTRAHQIKTGMPDWVTSLRFNGDFRGRFDGTYGDEPGFVDRNRWRYRLRAGFTAELVEDFEVGFRLVSGNIDSADRISSGINPISGNQTFQNNAAKKGVLLDTAYARWSPLKTAPWQGSITLGKMENPFEYSDLVFDSDYTPEGVAQQVAYTAGDGHTLRLSAGQFVLDEILASGRDPYLLGGQTRWEAAWADDWSTSFGAGFLGILNTDKLTSDSVPDINVGNERVVRRAADGRSFTLGAPVADFDAVTVDASVTWRLARAPLYNGAFPVRLSADYLHNLGADDASDGYSLGVSFGKAGRRRTWEVVYRWRHLEGDAWWEELVDSNSGGFYAGPFSPSSVPKTLRAPGTGFGGGTNLRGHYVRFAWSPYDFVTLACTYMNTEVIEEYQPGTGSRLDRIFLDASLKF